MKSATLVGLALAVLLNGCGGGGGSDAVDPVEPSGDDGPHVQGQFGAVFDWPVIPIHMALLPDGRVMAYGTGADGQQGAALQYSVWDPALGTGSASMQLLPNSTGTDIFCAGQVMMPATGELLIVGGDLTINGKRNYANDNVNIYRPASNTLSRQAQAMAFPRWYATAVTVSNGEQVVVGGMSTLYVDGGGASGPTPVTPASTPEVYSATRGWRTLSAATSDGAYGKTGPSDESWYYPRAWQAPDGRIFVLSHSGLMFHLSASGTGEVMQANASTFLSESTLPSVMYAPGKILSVRTNRVAVTVDINAQTPTVAQTGELSLNRRYGNATLLANGKVWVNGGSSTGNDLAGAGYHSETWDPASGRWTRSAVAAKARLYHSASLLLPDGRVLTGGGGAPGPERHLNAEIYYPPYLYKTDGSGQFAARPVIKAAPTGLGWGEAFQVEMNSTAPVSRVTLVRAGSVTHSFNNAQRFIEMEFAQAGAVLGLTSPAHRNIAPPGFYLLFAFAADGVPSVARMVRLME